MGNRTRDAAGRRPVVDDAAKAITVANAAGYAFRFDEAAIRSRVQDQPLAAPLAPPQPPALDASVDLGQGRAVFCAANSDWLLLLRSGPSRLGEVAASRKPARLRRRRRSAKAFSPR